jgi:intracellular septation protein A
LIDWALFALAGMNAADATTRFRAYSGTFLDAQTLESEDAASVGLELTVKAYLDERAICEVRSGTANTSTRAESLRPYAHWLRAALQAPATVWATWVVMIVVALADVAVRQRGAALGDFANIALLAAAAFAFIIATRRVRQRMRIADAFFPLVLLNPLFYTRHATPFDRTLLAAGVLGLMTGAIIAMKRDNMLRYIAVMLLALLLTAISDGFIMLLPALVAWLFAAGFLLARSRDGGSRVRGIVILGIGQVGLFIFGLACILAQPTQSPAPATLFTRIVSFVDFPLIVLAIIMLALGWRKGPNRSTPPHFAGVLALLVGLLTLLLNNFQSEGLPQPGTDQTVLLICLVYTVFALHGPKRLQWVVPPALLLAAVAYTFFQ